jgi:endonuclease/exonuclease/phosphatase family metal-dependent hydrolase
MAEPRGQAPLDLGPLLRLWGNLPGHMRLAVALTGLVVVVVGVLVLKNLPPPGGDGTTPPPDGGSTERRGEQPPVRDPGAGTYTFCFWNVENLFDDRNDGRTGPGDNVYDPWMADSAEARERKLGRLCEVLLGEELNGGKGPDVIALCEVESDRATELLQSALNARLTDAKLRYGARAFAGAGSGRHIGPALISRLPIEHDRTRQLGEGQRLRIMETRVKAAGQPLAVIASHWSSRVSDKTGAGRAKYADVIHGRFRQLYEASAAARLVVCGDFNDDPTDPNLTERLKAVGDAEAARGGGKLFDPFFALFEQGKKTLAHEGKGHLFDHICLSPGLLGGEGWSYVEGSARIVPMFANRNGRPIPFGGKSATKGWGARGASDHFPVVVQLRVR